jgi:hypothetical protein
MMDVVFQPLYLVVVLGIAGFLLLVLEALVGLKVIHFKGPAHRKTHKTIAFTLIALAFLHGVYALGTVVFGWF